jgi:hypothetical protein
MRISLTAGLRARVELQQPLTPGVLKFRLYAPAAVWLASGYYVQRFPATLQLLLLRPHALTRLA